jgi:type I restriction enzyme, R subunit
MRITGDNQEGKAELDNFIFPESRYPVIATTSKLMTTGVDAQTCKLVVRDQHIQSMTEFKQIIGRGTRINEDYGKFYFTIMDFKKATELFADEDFDGPPVCVYEPKEGESPVPPEDSGETEEPELKPDTGDQSSEYPEFKEEWGSDVIHEPGANDSKIKRFVVDNVPVQVLSERVQYYDAHGKLVTESLKDFTKRAVNKEYRSIDAFLKKWNHSDRKRAIIEELANQGIFFEALAEEVGRDIDPFDLVCHVVWDKPALTRRERAEQVKKRNYFTKYGEQARKVLDSLLEKYADQGVIQIEEPQILSVPPLSGFGTPIEIIRAFGGKDKYDEAIRELEQALYTA